jgi:hypothetical protein
MLRLSAPFRLERHADANAEAFDDLFRGGATREDRDIVTDGRMEAVIVANLTRL